MSFKFVGTEPRPEVIRINKNEVTMTIKSYSLKDHGHFVLFLPSLNLSSYGSTKAECEEMLNSVLTEFWGNFIELSAKNKQIELSRLGWVKDEMKHKNFSKAFIDKAGALKDLDLTDEELELVEESMMEVAA